MTWHTAPPQEETPGRFADLRRSPARTFALVFGVVYLLAGISGFLATGLHDFAGPLQSTLLIFAVNPLHNIVHIALGLAGLAGSRSHRMAKRTNLALGAVLGLVTILGFLHLLGFLGIDGLQNPDNFLHLVTGTVALYFGSAGAEPADPTDAGA
ncbi:MAG: DUF4383 domain-containing protein [Mycobacteriales bacterium]